jgi:hypothetical protein
VLERLHDHLTEGFKVFHNIALHSLRGERVGTKELRDVRSRFSRW